MISALIVAAGESKRMGRAKMLLPWGDTTVLGHVIEIIQSAGFQDILVVTGAAQAEVDMIASAHHVRTMLNRKYAEGEMLSSVQTGLKAMHAETPAVLIALGDQPQIQEATVQRITQEYSRAEAALIVPSYKMRRGHPWLVARRFWQEIVEMQAPDTLRDFLNRYAADIHYLEMDTPTILQDLDTPQDYLKSRP